MRSERDTLGEILVPDDALYGASTQRAVNNFKISQLRLQPLFVRALGLIKFAAAESSLELGLLTDKKGRAISQAAEEIWQGRWYEQFVVDVFQTGSGTSTNMNANEVIAARANQFLNRDDGGKHIHPNDDVK